MIDDAYEVANWAKLSPRFREAHNQRRVAHGMSALSPPKIDLYTGPKPLSAEDRRRFDIPAVMDINSLPPGVAMPRISGDEGGRIPVRL